MTLLLKPTVRQLKAAGAFVTERDKGVIAPPLNPLVFLEAEEIMGCQYKNLTE